MTRKIALVTGASSGVGREVAAALPARGYEVLGASRTQSGGPGVKPLSLDLANFASVRKLAADLRGKFPHLDLLVNNAGIHTARRELTEDGIERTFQVNHLGPFLLTRELMPLLERAPAARIVNVASEAHRGGALDFDDLDGAKAWSGIRAYTQSKLANIEFTYELARRLNGTRVTANAVHPGSVRTGWARGEESGIFRFGVALASPFLLSPHAAAKGVLRVATDPALEGVTGKYFVKGREANSSARSRREEDWTRLWDVSESLLKRSGI